MSPSRLGAFLWAFSTTSLTAGGSINCLARKTSATEVSWVCSTKPKCFAARSGPGLQATAPPCAPRWMVIRESDSSMRKASRKVGRDMPNRSIRSASAGRLSPSSISPRIIWLRNSLAISSDFFNALIGGTLISARLAILAFLMMSC